MLAGAFLGQIGLPLSGLTLEFRPGLQRDLAVGGAREREDRLGQMYVAPQRRTAVTDPVAAGVRLGRGTYFWDGMAGTWFWSDPENDLVLVSMVQVVSFDSRVSREVQFASRGVVADVLADLTDITTA